MKPTPTPAHAAKVLCDRFADMDFKQHGTPRYLNQWKSKRVLGTLPNGDVAHVFVK